jgi:Mitochondrial ribosomal protein L37
MDSKVATGVNIYQAGSDPPLPSDEECPDWLWELSKKPKTAKQLHEEARALGGYEHMEPEDYFRLLKLERKEQIKTSNAASRKR